MDASDEQLYRELKWLVPTTSLSTYVIAGRWHRKLLQVDLELIKAHRREAGAPEAAPVDLSQVLPELHGRVLLPHDAPEQGTMTQEVRVLKPPPPPAAPAYPKNEQAPSRQPFTSTKTASVKHAPPQSAPSKGVIKDGIVKTSSSSSTRLAPGGFAWGARASFRHSEMSHQRHFPRSYPSYPYSGVTEEVKSLPSRDGSKNAEEAPRQSFTSTTASVKHAPPRSAPSKGVIKDGIVKTSSSSSTRSVPSAPLGARSPKGPMAKQGGPNTLKRPGDSHDTRSDSGPKRSAPQAPAKTPAKAKSPAPPKGPPPGRTAHPTPPKHPPQQKGPKPLPLQPKPKGPTPPRHAPAPAKGSAPPRTAPASQSRATPQKSAGPPKGSSLPKSAPSKAPPSKAPTKAVAKEGSMNRPGPKSPYPPQFAPPGRAMVKQGAMKTPSRPVSHDRTAIGASQGSGTPPRPSSALDGRPPPKARPGSSDPGDLIRKMLK